MKLIKINSTTNDIAITFLNNLSASQITSDTNISYAFFLNANSRYIADVFIIKHADNLFFAAPDSILNNLFSHLAPFNFRKTIILEPTDLYLSCSENHGEYIDPRGIGYWNISTNSTSIPEWYIKTRIDMEIAEFTDFEHEKSIILEYGTIGKFISHTKGCYLGQELMQRVFTQGVIRKTVKKMKMDQKTDEKPDATINQTESENLNIIKILAKYEESALAFVRC